MITFDEAVAAIEGARRFPDLLKGPLAVARPAHAYRMLLKIVHPDVAPAGRRESATRAAAKLSALWAGTRPRQLNTPRASYRLGSLVASGDLADLHALDDDALLKMPRQPADNDLMRAEISALTTLHRDGDPRHRAYAPRLIESFTHEDAAGVRRTASILARQDGFVPLTGLEHRLDPRDVAWMWRRLLTGLGWAHRAGVVHGAVLPEHVLIHPGEHGLVLVDWCYSVAPGATVPAVVARYRDAYPPEVTGRGRPPPPPTSTWLPG
ncbi:hypothetical protein Asp14428_69300 [Actinoplanes sp. NBRC 14428]|nr:hypothetical protein Asp14428_69300 [Actinoplanes sp. NBRC 14428]